MNCSSGLVRRSLAITAAVTCLLYGIPAMQAADWKPAQGQMMTRWAADVSPQNALPDYPRPQMTRDAWQNLNGLWQFAPAAEKDEQPPVSRDLDQQILVPYPIESALSGIMERHERAWYRRSFEVPAEWREGRVLLHFGAVDWEARVLVNGKEVGHHTGGYDPFTFDITDALHPRGANELIVGVFDPTDTGPQPHGKQVNKPEGIWYTPTTGIWQTVWLEPVPQESIERLKIVPDVDGGTLKVTVGARGTSESREVEVIALDGEKEVGRGKGRSGEEISVGLAEPRLWSPQDPHLYDLRVTLLNAGKPIDEVTSYAGLRKIDLVEREGVARIALNGKELMQVGPLDQGFWPDGLYTAPTDAALLFDVAETKRLGFNMTRKHVKVEPARWYYHCDKLGLLVWQDMPHAHKASRDRENFASELKRMIDALHNQPSIVMWVVFNEGWGQHDTEKLTAWTKQYDPTRLASNASGWTDKGVGDIIDMHKYPGPGAPPTESRRAVVLGEFGGLGLPVEGHTWLDRKAWSYQGMADSEQLTLGYLGLMRQVWQLHRENGLSAAVYTQLTDVEGEINGLFTYDRAVLKMDAERVAASNQGRFPTERVLVATSEQEPQSWRFTTEFPRGEWQAPNFRDAKWSEGVGGFGTAGTPGAHIGTEWNSRDIWLRRKFDYRGERPRAMLFRVHHDEDVEIYLNGVKAAESRGYTVDYVPLPLSKQGADALVEGENVLAVHCKQTGGGQYIDVGLVELLEPAK